MNLLINKLSHTSGKCRSCKNKVLPFFSLGKIPLVNSFLREEEISREKKYDLTVGFCPSCFLVQLVTTVFPEAIFRDYVYFSSVSSTFLKHCEKTAEEFIRRFNLGGKSLVLEIASNDGALLQYFKREGVKVLGVEPARNIADAAMARGVPTIPEFFNQAFAKKIKKNDNVSADLIIGMNVLAHVPEIPDFLKGVYHILASEGTAVFEFPYIGGLFEGKFDTIYHEHVFYYSLLALKNLFKNSGLEIYELKMTPMQGGSLMIFAARAGIFPVSARVLALEERERKQGLDKSKTYKGIAQKAEKTKKELFSLFNDLKNGGKKIAGYGAPAKGNVLLNYCGIGKNYIDFIVDKAPQKHGLYTPGTHLLVNPLSKIYEAWKTDYLLILCWNLHEEVMSMNELKSFREEGGKFIIPIPEVKIV